MPAIGAGARGANWDGDGQGGLRQLIEGPSTGRRLCAYAVECEFGIMTMNSMPEKLAAASFTWIGAFPNAGAAYHRTRTAPPFNRFTIRFDMRKQFWHSVRAAKTKLLPCCACGQIGNGHD
jgi:hypothetical protein